MSTAPAGHTRHSILAPILIALAACAHAPPRAPTNLVASASAVPAAAPAPAAPSPGVSAPSAPASEPIPATPQALMAALEGVPAATAAAAPPPAAAPAAPDAAAGAVPPPSAPQAPNAAGALAPGQYADLFDRMRAGFKLESGMDRRAVEMQLRWYAANPDYLQRAFGRADLYLYQIVTELERRGMPLELALLPVVESAFEPYAYSRARASGLWQFVPGTASKFGLKQDWWYDGRRDIVESTRAALDYLESLHQEFDGDWLLAIAAYNCGEALVERAVAMNLAAHRPVDFWSLWLPRETRAYVPKLLAMKHLVAEPAAYGLDISPIPNQPYFERVDTLGQIDLKLAAQIAGISPEELYELNPAFHRWATDPSGPHHLLLPVVAADVFSENITQLSADQRLLVSRYTVARGDSAASIAKKFHTTVNVLRELNDLPSGKLTVGDELRVPATVSELPPKVMLAAARVDGRGRVARPHVVVRRGDTLWTIARRNGMNVNTLAMLNGIHPDDPLHAGQRIRLSTGGGGSSHHTSSHRVVYTVQEGDTVSLIAQLFQCSVPQLLAWNGLSAHSHIHTGQKLRIHRSHHS